MHINKLPFCAILSFALCAPAIAAKPEAPTAAFKSEKETISYAVGASVGRNFKKDDFDLDKKIFIQGLEDALAGAKLKISEQEFKIVMTNFQRDMRNKMVANQRELAVKNKKKAEEFLAENSKKEGVISLPSGVQYKIIKAGDGPKPQDADMVEVNYRGTVLDGKEFDANTPGKPASFKLAQVVPGWKEALKLMPVGSKWQLFIPAQHAYGERGVGSDIGPNEMLIFDVELLAIKQ